MRKSQTESDRDRAWNRFPLQPSHSASADMSNFAGNWKMKKSENFDELLKALGKLSPLSVLHEVAHPSCANRRRLFLCLGNGMQ